jgi:hypothetical protein
MSSPILPTDSSLRKDTPIFSGMLNYFPRAAAYVARISVIGNDKHNPGEPLHWAEGKSSDHLDCIARHAVENGTFDPDDGALHDGKLAWRAFAHLETVLKQRERDGLPVWDEEVIAKNKQILAEKLAEIKALQTRDRYKPPEKAPSIATPDLILRDGKTSSFIEPGTGLVIDQRSKAFSDFDEECVPGN